VTGETIGFTVAFMAGLLSFLSPCVLPLIPSYITFITGLSLDDAQRARQTALVHSTLFVTGFTLIFLALGAGATALGSLASQYERWITRAGGVLIILFGLYSLGVFNVAFLSRERRFHLSDKPLGYLGTVFVGVAFGAGWTPCIGPILGAILTYAGSTADFNRGMTLLTAYSLGLAVPFLAAALLLRHFLAVFTRLKKTMVWISRVTGVILIALGALMVTDYFSILSTYMMSLTPDYLRKWL
jgi:cytochrome c-type biogenesis protein